jgi:chromate transport protein ChrA
MLVLLMGATYPLALLGHLAVDLFAGDREFLREILYGYNRIVAARLVNGWLQSLVWVASIWLVLQTVQQLLPSLYVWFTVGTLGLAAALTFGTPLPPLIAWLITAAVLLHCSYSFLAVRRRTASG